MIGVNTAIFSPSGGSVGIGFDIPADTVKAVVAQLEDKGRVTRGWIGVQVQPVTTAIAESLGMKNVKGAWSMSPSPVAPPRTAGIQAGDVITAIDGVQVKDSRDLARKISAMAPGTSTRSAFFASDEQDMLTLGQLPGERQAQVGFMGSETHDVGSRLGLTLAPAGDVDGPGRGKRQAEARARHHAFAPMKPTLALSLASVSVTLPIPEPGAAWRHGTDTCSANDLHPMDPRSDDIALPDGGDLFRACTPMP